MLLVLQCVVLFGKVIYSSCLLCWCFIYWLIALASVQGTTTAATVTTAATTATNVATATTAAGATIRMTSNSTNTNAAAVARVGVVYSNSLVFCYFSVVLFEFFCIVWFGYIVFICFTECSDLLMVTHIVQNVCLNIQFICCEVLKG